MKELAIFDVDGTIVQGQSQQLFLRYLMSKDEISRVFFLKLMLWFAMYKIGLAKNPQKVMEYAFSFLKGKSVIELSVLIDDFFEKKLKFKIYPEAFEIINQQKKEGRSVILVSNAADIIIKKIGDYLGVADCLCTKLEVIDELYTGKILNNMYGKQKAEAVKQFIAKQNFDLDKSWAYGDHVSDQYILSLVGYPIVVNPVRALATLAHQRKWQTLNFKSMSK